MKTTRLKILIYAERSRASEAEALAARLRNEGFNASTRDTNRFESRDVERCDQVITDDPAVRAAYERIGAYVASYTDAVNPKAKERKGSEDGKSSKETKDADDA